jgi:outer membrane receptor protein involved in Fe transport
MEYRFREILSMKQAFILLPLLALLAVGATAHGQATGVVRGRVVDAATGQPLPGATVAVEEVQIGALADEAGRYQFIAPVGDHVLHFSFIGYATHSRDSVRVIADSVFTLDVALSPQAIALKEITVTPGRFSIMGRRPESTQTLTRQEIQTIPQFGEDVFRAVTRLPGVSSSDFSAKFTVRGGEHDEVLVLVDGLELYDPFHLKDIGGGALSIVDVAVIEGIDLLTGGFPAEYGDRLSGVFNVETATPEPGRRRGAVGLSFMNARAMIEGADERSAYLLSARRGYLDLVLALMGEDEEISPTYYDLFGKYVYKLSDRQILQTSLLHAHDHMDLIEGDADESTTGYGNTYAWFNLKSVLSPRLYAQSVLSLGRVTHDRQGIAFFNDDGSEFDFSVSDVRDFDLLALRQDWSFELSDRHYLKWGMDGRRLTASYDYLSLDRHLSWITADSVQVRVDTTRVDLAPSSNEFGLYAADRFRILSPLTAEVGLRFDYAEHTGDELFSPRLNLVYSPNKRTSLRAGWGRFYQSQGIHELDAPDGEEAFHPAELAEHRVIGLEHLFAGGLHLRLEAYRKSLSSLSPAYRNWLNEIEIFPELQSDRVRVELKGATSRGVEVYLKQDSGGRFTWWASYALARVRDEVKRVVADDGSERIVDGEIPGIYDQRHTFYLDLNYRPTDRWHLNTAFQYRNGWPYTDRTLHLGRWPDGRIYTYEEVGALNGRSYPAFHRLDLRINRYFDTAKGRITAFLEVTNLYNHGNVRTYSYFWSCGEDGDCRRKRDAEHWFRLLPSIGLTWGWDM